MTSPYAFYQYWLNVEDASVVTLLKVFTDRTREEVADSSAGWRRSRSAVRRRRPWRPTSPPWSTDPRRRRGQAASEALFGKGDLRALDAATLRDADAPSCPGRGGGGDVARRRPRGGGGSWSRATPPAG